MPLKLTLRAGEIAVVNGCVIRNADRRQSFWIDTRADILRGSDLLDPADADTPVKRAYCLAQDALLRPDGRDETVPALQSALAALAASFASDQAIHLFRAATHVSRSDYYQALSALRPLLAREAEHLAPRMARAEA